MEEGHYNMPSIKKYHSQNLINEWNMYKVAEHQNTNLIENIIIKIVISWSVYLFILIGRLNKWKKINIDWIDNEKTIWQAQSVRNIWYKEGSIVSLLI